MLKRDNITVGSFWQRPLTGVVYECVLVDDVVYHKEDYRYYHLRHTQNGLEYKFSLKDFEFYELEKLYPSEVPMALLGAL